MNKLADDDSHVSRQHQPYHDTHDSQTLQYDYIEGASLYKTEIIHYAPVELELFEISANNMNNQQSIPIKSNFMVIDQNLLPMQFCDEKLGSMNSKRTGKVHNGCGLSSKNEFDQMGDSRVTGVCSYESSSMNRKTDLQYNFSPHVAADSSRRNSLNIGYSNQMHKGADERSWMTRTLRSRVRLSRIEENDRALQRIQDEIELEKERQREIYATRRRIIQDKKHKESFKMLEKISKHESFDRKQIQKRIESGSEELQNHNQHHEINLQKKIDPNSVPIRKEQQRIETTHTRCTANLEQVVRELFESPKEVHIPKIEPKQSGKAVKIGNLAACEKQKLISLADQQTPQCEIARSLTESNGITATSHNFSPLNSEKNQRSNGVPATFIAKCINKLNKSGESDEILPVKLGDFSTHSHIATTDRKNGVKDSFDTAGITTSEQASIGWTMNRSYEEFSGDKAMMTHFVSKIVIDDNHLQNTSDLATENVKQRVYSNANCSDGTYNTKERYNRIMESMTSYVGNVCANEIELSRKSGKPAQVNRRNDLMKAIRCAGGMKSLKKASPSTFRE